MSSRKRRVTAIVVAAGRGHRLGAARPKAFVDIEGETLLRRSVRALLGSPLVSDIVVVAPAGLRRDARAEASVAGTRLRAVVAGGATRSASVRAGLRATTSADDVVLVHDAARPFVDSGLVARVVAAARTWGAAIPVVPVTDTIKAAVAPSPSRSGARRSSPGVARRRAERLGPTVDRDGLRAAQTPQGFVRDQLLRALETARRRGVEVTDEAMAIELMGGQVVAVSGDVRNVKITTSADLESARGRLVARTEARIGHGFDSHRLAPGRPLVLGGVRIRHSAGLVGHSDGDALLHAICDALLGAAALGDLGSFFPSSNPTLKDASSAMFLSRVVAEIRRRGFRVANVDATVIAEAPRLAAPLSRARRPLARALGLPFTSVSLKAKSADALGSIGRGEGIAAHAVVLIERSTTRD